MKQVILYGAFDRYNYGDNLMPIVFEEYTKKYHSNSDIEFIYAAISNSHKKKLEKYLCKNSLKIEDVIKRVNNNSTLIVVGGEVLTATNSILALHMQSSRVTHKILRSLSKVMRSYFSYISNIFYSTSWEYPFVIPKEIIEKYNLKVIYNTVGGDIENSPHTSELYQRLRLSRYVSVRDCRSLDSLSNLDNTVMSPDSVFLISKIFNKENIIEYISPNLHNLESEDYIVIQFAPSKVGCKFDDVVKEIRNIYSIFGKKIKLLPIGYASGHDDYEYLNKIYHETKNITEIYYSLNVYEIMYIIMNSHTFIGTSLHGVITAMSYGIPHFGINKKVRKLDSFLKTWSIPPYNKSYDLKDIKNILADDFDSRALKGNAEKIINNVMLNNEKVISIINEK